MAKTPMDLVLDGVTWEPVKEVGIGDDSDGIPYATHSGVLNIGGHELKCFRLSNGQTVFDADDFNSFFSSIAEGE